MILPDLERESTGDEGKKNVVLAAWYVIEPSRNLERFAKAEQSSTRRASGCSNGPVNCQAQEQGCEQSLVPT